MLTRLTRWLTRPDPPPTGGSWNRAIVAAAAILTQLAEADGEVDDEEREAVARALRRRFHFDVAAVDDILAHARNARDEGVELATFVRHICAGCDPTEKREILRAMHEVVWADGVLHPREAELAGRVARLLGMPEPLVTRREPPAP